VKLKYPNLKTVISIGGENSASRFSTITKTNASIAKAARNIVNFCNNYGFDGVDLDWEFPSSPEESNQYLNLVKKLRQFLGDDKILTMAVSTNPDRHHGYVSQYMYYLNWINVMSYNYAGSWSKYTGFNAPLYSTPNDKNKQSDSDQSIRRYIAQGIPPSKLVLGGAFYGRTWVVESSENNGFNQIGDGKVKGQSSDDDNEGVWTYYALRTEKVLKNKTTPYSPWKRTWHSSAKSPTLFNPRDNRYISYDDVESMRERVKYVKENELSGFMVWEISQDYNRELIDAIVDEYYG
ncbi:glycoside hydrolase, partial [Anaeromyces robustus]